MERFAVGDVVSVPFPFADQSSTKVRPALVLAAWPMAGTNDYLLAMISSRLPIDVPSLELTEACFASGGLPRVSYIRPWYLMTANASILGKRFGSVTDDVLLQTLRHTAVALRIKANAG